jgi:hypothetical protein
MLPINLIFKTIQPQKDAKFKITFTVDSDHIDTAELFSGEFTISLLLKYERFMVFLSFTEIFNELSGNEGGENALGVQNLYTSSIVTIVAAKNSSRLR